MRAARIGLNSINGFNLNLTVASNVNNLNLLNLAVANNWNSTIRRRLNLSLTINSGVTVGSGSYLTPALIVEGFPESAKITIINNGNIWGAGGIGGSGGAGTTDATKTGNAGSNGGDAILLNNNATITNNGTIYGGGGGGGGGGGYYTSTEDCWTTYNCYLGDSPSTECGFIGTPKSAGAQCSTGCNYNKQGGKCKCQRDASRDRCNCWTYRGWVTTGTACGDPVISTEGGGGGGFGRGSNNTNFGSGVLKTSAGDGGNGGGFGSSGLSGTNGTVNINGSASATSFGTGGLAGHYIKNKTRVTFINNGTVLGRFE